MISLTEEQAYAAMLLFLDRYNRATKSSGEIGALISGMHLVAPGDTFDPAYWYEWMEDVQTVLEASKTRETWAQFQEEHLAYTLTAPDGTHIRARPGRLPRE